MLFFDQGRRRWIVVGQTVHDHVENTARYHRKHGSIPYLMAKWITFTNQHPNHSIQSLLSWSMERIYLCFRVLPTPLCGVWWENFTLFTTYLHLKRLATIRDCSLFVTTSLETWLLLETGVIEKRATSKSSQSPLAFTPNAGMLKKQAKPSLLLGGKSNEPKGNGIKTLNGKDSNFKRG